MGTYRNAFDRFKETCNRVGKRTGDVVSVQKMKLDIADLEASREQIFATLGRAYYERLQTEEDVRESDALMLEKIDQKNAEIRALQEEIAAVQEQKYCPKCNTLMAKSSNFCSYCGYKMAEEEEKKE